MQPKKYIVNCLSVTGIRKQPYTYGEIVTENDFPTGQAEKKLASKHLREYTPNIKKDELLGAEKLQELNKIELDPPPPPPGKDDGDNPPNYEAMTVKDLKALLDEKKIPYDGKANKKTLIDLLQSA